MNRLLFGFLLLTACGREITAPTVLKLGPVSLCCQFTDLMGPPTANGQITTVGKPLTIALAVTDQNDKPVSGVSIHWAVAHDNGFTDVASSVTDSIGNAKVSWSLDT